MKKHGSWVYRIAVVAMMCSGGLTLAETIAVDVTLLQASTSELTDHFEESLAAAISAADRAHDDRAYRRAGGTGRTVATVAITATEGEGNRFIALNLTGGSGEEAALVLRAPWDEILPHLLTQALRYFEPVVYGWPSPEAAPIEYIDELALEHVRPRSPAHSTVSLYPSDLTTMPDGNIVIAGNTFAVEIDPLFRVRSFPGSELLDQGNYTYARATAATPAGTLYLQPGQGTDLYRIVPGATRPQRIRNGVGGYGPLVVLPDGSVVTIDTVAKRAVRIAGRNRTEVSLFTHPHSYVTAAAAGPTGNIWVFDATEQRLIIHTPDGRVVDSIIPAVPTAISGQTIGIAPYRDGDFVLLTRVGLWKFARDGQPEWSLPYLPDGRESGFQQAVAVAVDSNLGYIYTVDSARRTITRLRDLTIAARHNDAEREHHERLAAINRDIARVGEDVTLLTRKARLYDEVGASTLAGATWRYVLDLDPFNTEAQIGLERVELARLVTQADEAAAAARRQLSRLGPASARADYLQALQLYEQLLAIRPDMTDAADRMDELRRDFAGDGGGEGGSNPLTLDGVVLDNIFPSLLSIYRTRPVGTVTVVNRGQTPLTEVRAQIEVRRYSDFPTVTELTEPIPPGGRREIPLRLVLNTNVFEVEEDLPLQADVRVSASAAGREYTRRSTGSLTLHRRTALTWIETERLAAFITPNESNVGRFAFAATTAVDEESTSAFSRPFLRAARIIDALGLYGISYVEDPRTPISAVLQRTDVVDTVRFPRSTLLNRVGDCDDTSALLASLLEAVGIPTAIVTTPDHVLIAFDTGEPASNAWIYESAGYPVVTHGDTVWLPVETTVMRRGFVGTIRAAAQRIEAAGGVEAIGFIATEVARGRYPTIPVPPTQLNVTLPSAGSIVERGSRTTEELALHVYRPAVAALERRVETNRSAPLLSRLGSLHSRFGMTGEAERSFSAAIEAAPETALPRVHFASYLLSQDRPERAVAVLEPAIERFPDAVLIHALLARSYIDSGWGGRARRHIQLVNDRSPSLAARYAILDRDGAARASDEFDPATAVLPDSEEAVRSRGEQ
ncbi:MAG: hypothetical protein MI724_01235 [Spirochaetales bacterium]|nr:hypothetical protein [Spirochaetales bacterium]